MRIYDIEKQELRSEEDSLAVSFGEFIRLDFQHPATTPDGETVVFLHPENNTEPAEAGQNARSEVEKNDL